MKKLFFGLVMFFVLIISQKSYSAVSGSTYYVNGFIESTQLAHNLLQSNTGANYSCGPT